MKTSEIRQKYLEFFEKRGHKIIPSASLLPENDPTTLFTGSGMQPLLPYLLGETHPQGTRLVNSQKSFRSGDIEEVGDNRHTTFFEMLGNWSLGDYFKEEQIPWMFEFLTKEVKLDPTHLYITCFIGAPEYSIPKDMEAAELWQKLFMQKGVEAATADIGSENNGYKRGIKSGERIFYYDGSKNWWNRGKTGLDTTPIGDPCGPSSEMFYEFTQVEHDKKFGENCHPNCDCGRFMEIGNNVFMTYRKEAEGKFVPLEKRNIDHGSGLERVTAASLDNPDVFEIDALKVIITHLEKSVLKPYSDDNVKRSYRIVADHIRGAVMMILDGVTASNTDAGYFLRRLIRRAVQHMDLLGAPEHSLHTIVPLVVSSYCEAYPKLKELERRITEEIKQEEGRFRKTLVQGKKEFEKTIAKGSISGLEAFTLFSTYGFPLELIVEFAPPGTKIDTVGFAEEMKKHQELSRSGAEQKFKGGLADHSEMSVKYHTATHLLHQALREVLGPSVYQKGSNITPERLRFDFSFDRKMTGEEKKEVEDIVNEKIKEAIPVSYEDIPLEEAKKRGAIGLFEEKYGDKVRVYKIGDFSLEFCGGPHVKNTSELGTFKIAKEEAISAGIRRIKATLS